MKKQEGEDRSRDVFSKVGTVHRGRYYICWEYITSWRICARKCGIVIYNFGAINSAKIVCKHYCSAKTLFKMVCSFFTGKRFV